ncbi:MAG: hypothetical protein K2K64_05370, partial [Muribaculaceae bacterium]|nr:hypothetical protein [Muribaculaceae bacterium]
GITAMHCLGKHLFRVDKAKFLVIYHDLSKFFVRSAHFDAKIQKNIVPAKPDVVFLFVKVLKIAISASLRQPLFIILRS